MFDCTCMNIGVAPGNDILIEAMRSHMVVVIIGLLLMAYVAAAGRIMYPNFDLNFIVIFYAYSYDLYSYDLYSYIATTAKACTNMYVNTYLHTYIQIHMNIQYNC